MKSFAFLVILITVVSLVTLTNGDDTKNDQDPQHRPPLPVKSNEDSRNRKLISSLERIVRQTKI